MELLKSLHGRLNDSAPVVRVRAAQSISELLKEVLLSSNEIDSTNSEGGNSTELKNKDVLTRSIIQFSSILAESLRKRALEDDKATVRRAAINGLVSVISISNIQFAAVTNNNNNVHRHHLQEDINVLRQLCNDASVVMRRAAAEGVTSLLLLKK